jgi:hypothetical protein
MDLTLSDILTAAGAVSAALVVRQLVELIKVSFPGLAARASGAAQAFVLTFLLYAFAWVAVGAHTPEGFFLALVSWLACATSAVGIDATWNRYRSGGG